MISGKDQLTFFGGMETTAEDFAFALQTRGASLMEYVADAGIAGEVKKAFDALKVSIIGRPQRPRDDMQGLMDWYRRNELVFACVEKISQAAQDPEIIVEQKKGKTWATVDGHGLRSLMLKPNALDDGASFVGAWLASKHIAGRFFAEIVLGDDGKPSALWPLHPGKVFPIPGKGRDGSNIVGWKYKDGYIEVDFTPEEILCDRNRDLGSHFDAVSPLAVALGAVDMDTAQTEYVRAFFNNGGVPSGILRFKDRSITKEQSEQKRQQWALRYGRAGQNPRGIAVLDQGAEYQAIGSNIKELEADSLRGQAEARICMVFGVPPILVGAYVGLRWVNQRASAREAQEDFWINKMSPTFKALRSFLTWNLLNRWEDPQRIRREEIRVGWDMTNVLALKEDTDKRSKRALEEFRGGLITQNEGREGIGREKNPEGDFYLIPSSMNPRTGDVILSIAKQPPQAPPAADPNAPTTDPAQGDPAKALTGNEADFWERLSGALNESKTRWQLPPAPSSKVFVLDGLPLAREPKDWEASLDLKAIANAPKKSADKIKGFLLGLRKNLIRQAVEALADRDPADLHSVVLVTPPPKVYKQIRTELDSSYKLGRALVDAEAGRQRPKSTFIPKQFKDDPEWEWDEETDEFLDEIGGTTVSRVVNSVQSVAAGILAKLSLLGIQGAERRARIKSELDDSSTAGVEQAASSVAQVAMCRGRDAEISDRSDEIKRVLYSAILDTNTCPTCEAADGQEAESVDELPPAPNDECDGGDKCRCFHVAIFEDEASDAAD